MQFKLLPSFIMFLGSYFPLSIILILQDIPSHAWSNHLCTFSELTNFFDSCNFPSPTNPLLAYSLVAITFLSLIFVCTYLKILKGKTTLKIEDSKLIPNDLINYTFPYVVSFMGLSLDEHGKLAGALVFLLFMFLLTFRSGEIIMNPILLLLGWHIYEVTGTINNQKRKFKALSKFAIHSNDNVKSRRAQNIYIITDRSHSVD